MKEIPLNEAISDSDLREDPTDNLRARLDRMETESEEYRRRSEQRIVLAELRVEAMRAGIIDMDGLKFIDTTQIRLESPEDICNATELVTQLKQTKPWLFSAPSSSSVARVPPSKPARQKLAIDMTDDEYRIARANIIKNSLL
jgi:hypothetical protein